MIQIALLLVANLAIVQVSYAELWGTRQEKLQTQDSGVSKACMAKLHVCFQGTGPNSPRGHNVVDSISLVGQCKVACDNFSGVGAPDPSKCESPDGVANLEGKNCACTQEVCYSRCDVAYTATTADTCL